MTMPARRWFSRAIRAFTWKCFDAATWWFPYIALAVSGRVPSARWSRSLVSSMPASPDFDDRDLVDELDRHRHRGRSIEEAPRQCVAS